MRASACKWVVIGWVYEKVCGSVVTGCARESALARARTCEGVRLRLRVACRVRLCAACALALPVGLRFCSAVFNLFSCP